MLKINPKFECKYCSCVKKTRDAFENHIYLCKYIHTNPQEREVTLPPPHILLNYIVDLSKKYEKLESKMEELNYLLNKEKKRDAANYLKTQTCSVPYAVWVNKLKVSDADLNYMLETDGLEVMKRILKTVITSSVDLQEMPFRAFKQKQNLYIYDRPTPDSQVFEWRIASNEDIGVMIKYINKQLFNRYMEWNQENESSGLAQYDEMNMAYMKKINENSKNMDSKALNLKRSIIEEIQMNL